jgi:hypothetical protein
LLRATITTSMVVAAAACGSIDRATAPSPNVPTGTRTASSEVFVPVQPVVPCLDSIFKADFSGDVLNAYPGAPWIGTWTGNQSAGTIRVRGIVSPVVVKYAALTQYAGLTGGVSLSGKIRCASPASTGVVVVEWSSMVNSPTAFFGAIVLRDDQSRVLAAVEYRANGVVTYNGITIPGVTWAKDMVRRFRIRLDLTGHKSSLYVDGQLKLVSIPYFEASAAGLWRINMELGGTSAQTFVWDDIVAVRYAY